jgi:hypothetical protein
MKAKKRIPYEFVFDGLTSMPVRTNPMFGSTAIYVREKIVLILRERESSPEDNGVWVATTLEHHDSLRKDLPSMRSIAIFSHGRGLTGWQVIPASEGSFERDVMRACELIVEGDVRIGKIPKPKAGTAARRHRKQGIKDRSGQGNHKSTPSRRALRKTLAK